MKMKILLFCTLVWMLHLTAFSQQDTNDYFKEGKAKWRAGDLEGALTSLNKAVETKPGDANAYSVRGSVKYYKGDKDGAIDDFSRAIELNTNCVNAYMARGALWAKKERHGQSISRL